MATLGTYYYDSSSFTNATTIYDDADLTIVSQNGWYSDNTIVRQQISGVLYAGQVCATPTPVPTPTAPIPVPSPVAPSPVPVPVPVPTPTAPVPAPVVQCYYYQLKYNPLSSCSGTSVGYYGDFSNFCTATQLYTDSACTQQAPSGYYTTFSSNEVRFWTGIAFQDSCQSC
jgi:hypothetical protein